MKFELGYEAVDEIFKAVLINDWKSIKADLKEQKRLKKAGQLADFLLEDYKANKKLKKAYETVIRYYYWSGDAERIIAGDDDDE